MTATRDRRSDLHDDADAGPAWDERPFFGQFRGLPWWGAVLLALGLAALAAVVDMQRQGTLGVIYQGAYVVGCLAAVVLVRRRNLFGPMVQPPLVFAVTAIGAVVVLQPGEGGGVKQLLFSVALPLTSNFPTMGFTTAIVVAIGIARLFVQRDPEGRTEREPAPAKPRKRPPVEDEPRAKPVRERERPAKAAPAERAREERRPRPPREDPRPAKGARPERPARPEKAERPREERAGQERPRRREPGAAGAGRPREERGTPERRAGRPAPRQQPPRRPRDER